MIVNTNRIEGRIIDLYGREIYEGSVIIKNGVIVDIKRHKTDKKRYIMPGFIDSHVHIESSMLTPYNFGNLVIRTGTVAVVSDPHEIANVMGVGGVEFMIKNSKQSPIKSFFTAPSCVPATPFDVAGSTITASDLESLISTGQFVALSEMMNVPGVLYNDPEVNAKLEMAKKYDIPIDGHAPLLSGEPLKEYIQRGISTDHEVSDIDEAIEKLSLGMKILIREGSAARNYDNIKSLISSHTNDVMFCTDDSHPDTIIELGHIDKIVCKAIAEGFDLFDVLRIASINPIEHYNLNVGTLREGDSADFIVVEDIETFKVHEVYIEGEKKYDVTQKIEQPTPIKIENLNNFNHDEILPKDLQLTIEGSQKVIGVRDGELITSVMTYESPFKAEDFESDIKNDILKIVYINRYTNGKPQVALCNGFSLKCGAFASSVGHDSHNIVAVGCNNESLCNAINSVISTKGGLSIADEEQTHILELPIAGIMSNNIGEIVAKEYKELNAIAKNLGCRIKSPFMTLSFLSLVVIPEIKIGEKGVFLYEKFDWA